MNEFKALTLRISTILILINILNTVFCWQPLIPVNNSTFVYPNENYTLFSSPIVHVAAASADSTRGYGFGGYDDDDRYVYSHSTVTVGNSLDNLNNLLGILSLVGLLGTALFALIQTRNGSRSFVNGPFEFLERNNLELDFSLPNFFKDAGQFFRDSIWQQNRSDDQKDLSVNSEKGLEEAEENGDEDVLEHRTYSEGLVNTS